MKSLDLAWSIDPEDFPFDGSSFEKIKFLLKYAILAPSAHNAQPWKVRIADSALEVYYDRTRALPVSDPTNRQAYLSLGAFVCNFVVASEAFGATVAHRWLPNGVQNNRPIAVIELSNIGSLSKGNIKRNDLKNVLERRVNRQRYTSLSISQELKNEITGYSAEGIQVALETRKDKIGAIASLVAAGTRFAFSQRPFREELSAYVVPTVSNRNDGIPGDTANLNLISSFLLPTIMKYFNIGSSQAKKEKGLFLSSSAVIAVAAERDDHISWLTSGFIFEKLALNLTKLGIAFAVSGAAIEPPMSPNILSRLMSIKTRPMVLCRIGKTKNVPPHSPRRPVADILFS